MLIHTFRFMELRKFVFFIFPLFDFTLNDWLFTIAIVNWTRTGSETIFLFFLKKFKLLSNGERIKFFLVQKKRRSVCYSNWFVMFETWKKNSRRNKQIICKQYYMQLCTCVCVPTNKRIFRNKKQRERDSARGKAEKKSSLKFRNVCWKENKLVNHINKLTHFILYFESTRGSARTHTHTYYTQNNCEEKLHFHFTHVEKDIQVY